MICPSCTQERPEDSFTLGNLLSEGVRRAVRSRHPHWSDQQVLCRWCVNQGEADYAQARLEKEMGPLSSAERSVIKSIRDARLLSVDAEDEFERDMSSDERLANCVAESIGTWAFFLTILAALSVWIAVNVIFRPFEPFPLFMLAVISAVLASLAALQGPIIIYTQRHQRKRDRSRAKRDYQVNLKAELEIQSLNDKLDGVLE